jgi:hypothetical protein
MFTLFPELPSELRLKILHYAMPGPRILGVGHRIKYTTHYGRTLPESMEWITSDPVPALLHVSHESRFESLKIYQPSLGSPSHPGKNYIDFDNDTLYFGGAGRGFSDLESLLGSAFDRPGNYLLDMLLGADHGTKDAGKIQRMIVDIDEDRYGRRMFIWDEIRFFTSLRELTILVWEQDSKKNELMDFYLSTLWKTARKNPDWRIPEITIIATPSKNIWGVMNAATVLEHLHNLFSS